MIGSHRVTSSPVLRSPQTGNVAPSRASRWHWLALCLVVSLAGFLRLHQISDVGIRFDDESAYVSDARLWHRCAALLLDTLAPGTGLLEDKAEFQRKLKEAGIDFTARYVKPCQGYTFAGALMMFAVGEGPLGLTAFNAICGTLTVVLLYLWSSLLFGRAVALAAAFLLAVSPYHLDYCRAAWPIVPSGFAILLGVYLWTLGHKGRLNIRTSCVLSGMAVGYAMTCHYSVGYVIPLVMLLDYFAARQQHRTPDRPPDAALGDRATDRVHCRLSTRWALTLVGIAMPIVAIELVFRMAQIAAWYTDSYLPLISYSKACLKWLSLILRADIPGEDMPIWQIPLTYATYFNQWQGPVACAALVAGAGVLLRRRGVAKLPAAVICLVLLLLTIQRYTIVRALATAIPFACVCMAAGMMALAARLRVTRGRQHVVLVALVAVIALPAAGQTWHVHQRTGDLQNACAFIVRNAGGVVAVPFDTCHGSKYATYLATAPDVTIVRNHSGYLPKWSVSELRARGVRWVITDPQHWHAYAGNRENGGLQFQRWQDLGAELARSATLAASFSHLTDDRWSYLGEGIGLRALSEMSKQGGGGIRVFDLKPQPKLASLDPQVSPNP